MPMYSLMSESDMAILIPAPPSRYEGRTSTGYPSLPATSTASSAVNTVPPDALGMPVSFKILSNKSLSSAASTSSADVPSIFTPISIRALVSPIAVWPPN